jgi:hypothetical protein
MKKLLLIIPIALIALFAYLFIGKPSESSIVEKAIAIQKKYKVTNDKYVVMVDYSRSILEKRFYLVNTKTQKLEMTSIVSHAWNSGMLYASDFSNEHGSEKSSLGAYLTDETTYYGKFGYALRIKGLEKTNSNAKERAIVIHSSKVMIPIWSAGCFALPENNTKKMIDMIKGGCLLYAYK